MTSNALAPPLRPPVHVALCPNQATYGQLQRTLDCFDHCVVLIDTSVEGWRVLHANAAWTKLTGEEEVADLLGRHLQGVRQPERVGITQVGGGE